MGRHYYPIVSGPPMGAKFPRRRSSESYEVHITKSRPGYPRRGRYMTTDSEVVAKAMVRSLRRHRVEAHFTKKRAAFHGRSR